MNKHLNAIFVHYNTIMILFYRKNKWKN